MTGETVCVVRQMLVTLNGKEVTEPHQPSGWRPRSQNAHHHQKAPAIAKVACKVSSLQSVKQINFKVRNFRCITPVKEREGMLCSLIDEDRSKPQNKGIRSRPKNRVRQSEAFNKPRARG